MRLVSLFILLQAIYNWHTHEPAYAYGEDVVLEAEAECDQTLVTLSGIAPGSEPDSVYFLYPNLYWQDGSAAVSAGWAERDTLVAMPYQTAGTYTLPPLYMPSTLLRAYGEEPDLTDLNDGLIAETTVASDKAFKIHLKTVTTTRGEEMRNNEMSPPLTDDVLSGSAPLEVRFYANPTPNARFVTWTIYNGSERLFSRNEVTFRYTFMDYGTFGIALDVMSGEDCKQHDSVTVITQESLLKVPNVFTPNGDGYNDEFKVQYRSLREYHIWIYNRWGHLVYESTDPSKGWDGRIGSRPAAEGAYFYVIRALGNNAPKDASFGTKIDYNKRKKSPDQDVRNSLIGVYRLSGDINLIRGM